MGCTSSKAEKRADASMVRKIEQYGSEVSDDRHDCLETPDGSPVSTPKRDPVLIQAAA